MKPPETPQDLCGKVEEEQLPAQPRDTHTPHLLPYPHLRHGGDEPKTTNTPLFLLSSGHQNISLCALFSSIPQPQFNQHLPITSLLLEKEMATHSSILAWKIPWMEEPGRPSPWGHKELDMTE